MFNSSNFGRVGIYNEKFSSIKSPVPFRPWSRKVKKNILGAVSLLVAITGGDLLSETSIH